MAEYREHGQEAFTYEVLQKLDEDVAEMSVHWLSQMNARPLKVRF